MGKSRSSPLNKTGSSIGLGGSVVSAGASVMGASTQSTQNTLNQPIQASQTQVQKMQEVLQNNVNAPTIQSLGNDIDVTAFKQMSDDQLAQIITQSQSVDLPNQLNDVHNEMQKFTYYAGLNRKPDVLDSASFQQYMKDNGISQSEVMSRSVNPGQYKLPSGQNVPLSSRQVADMYMYSDSHYIGGKKGGSVHGYGGYFDQNGGGNTGYGGGRSVTMEAVYSKNAKIISESSINSSWTSFASTHPKANKAMSKIRDSDSSQNMKAILMGYNVVKCSNSYRVILDRSALVFKQ